MTCLRLMQLAHRMTGLQRRVVAAVVLATGLLAMASPARAQTEPGAPRYLQIKPGDGKVTLHWKPPASDGGAPITGYEYRYKSTGNNYPAAWTVVPDESLTVGHGLGAYHIHPGLMNGTAYTFQVHAVNSEGSGMPSNEANDKNESGTDGPNQRWVADTPRWDRSARPSSNAAELRWPLS